MKLGEILHIIGGAYPEIRKTYLIGEYGIVVPVLDYSGDGLATFIFNEIVDTYDPSAIDIEQVDSAANAISVGMEELEDIKVELERVLAMNYPDISARDLEELKS